MTFVIRVAGADWSNKGFPNIEPFVATEDLEYAFDFRQRADMLTDFAGKHVITPKKVDPAAGILNVTDSSILVPVDDGQGVRIELGYMQCDLPAAAFATVGGATKFTIMVVSRGSGVTFPAGKVVGSAPIAMSLLDYGSMVQPVGFALTRYLDAGRTVGRISHDPGNLVPETSNKAVTAPDVSFLTFDGTTWTLNNATRGMSVTGTSVGLGVANPLFISPVVTWTDGMICLGGNPHRTSTLHAAYPVIYQSARWNRVLTGPEMSEQHARAKAGRPALAL